MALSLDEVEARALARWQPARPTYDAEKCPDWFHEDQIKAWNAEPTDILIILAGWQSGKTVFGPHWLAREVQRNGAGDYGIGAPTFRLLDKKVLPEFLNLFKPWGTFNKSDAIFTFNLVGEQAIFGKAQQVETKVFFGYAENPDSLESSTFKAFWGDETGQKAFKADSHEVIRSRVAVNSGKILYTSRPFLFNWFYELCKKADGIKTIIINFTSLANPHFPKERYESERKSMPSWRFALKYEGKFTRPAGVIYDCFDDAKNIIEEDGDNPWTIPEGWDVYAGQDFGDRNMAGVFVARGPDGQLVCFASYHKGHVTVKEHIANLRRKATQPTAGIAGGAPSEDDWRRDFTVAGWPIMKPPIRDVEVGISRVYRLIADGRLKFTRLGAHAVIDEINRYAREVNDAGEPIDKIADKETFHRLDALRYVCSTFFTYAESSRTPIARGKLIHV